MGNEHIGSSFEDFLKEEGLHADADTHAINTKKASMAEIERMRKAGEIHSDPNASEIGEDLGADFWENAHVEAPKIPIKSKA